MAHPAMSLAHMFKGCKFKPPLRRGTRSTYPLHLPLLQPYSMQYSFEQALEPAESERYREAMRKTIIKS